MNREDMFAELNQSPNVSSQHSYVNQGQPRMGADAMYQQMRDPRSVVRPSEMQMPRGTGFGQQGGYQGQVYNTPPTGSGFGNMNQAPQMTPQMKMQLMEQLKRLQGGGQISQGDMQNVQQANPMARPQPLRPEQIMELRRQQHQQRLQEMFDQERTKGMLE